MQVLSRFEFFHELLDRNLGGWTPWIGTTILNALLELGCFAHSMVNGDSAVLLPSTP